MPDLTPTDVLAWTNAALAAGEPQLARELSADIEGLSPSSIALIDCLAGDFVSAAAQLRGLPSSAVALPGPDCDVEQSHLVFATVRAAQGDDAAYQWLRLAFVRLGATAAYATTGRLFLAAARARQDWETCADLSRSLLESGVDTADVSDEAAAGLILHRPIGGKDAVDHFWISLVAYFGWLGIDRDDLLSGAVRVSRLLRDRGREAAAQILLEYAQMGDSHGLITAEVRRHRGHLWLLRNVWVRSLGQGVPCLLALAFAPWALPLLLIPILWDVVAARANGFTVSESAALFWRAKRQIDPKTQLAGWATHVQAALVAAGLLLGIGLDALIFVVNPSWGSLNLDDPASGGWAVALFILAAPAVGMVVGSRIGQYLRVRRTRAETRRITDERLELTSACHCPSLAFAHSPAADLVAAHHLELAGEGPSDLPARGEVLTCPATGIRFLQAPSSSGGIVLLAGDRETWELPDFVPSDWVG